MDQTTSAQMPGVRLLLGKSQSLLKNPVLTKSMAPTGRSWIKTHSQYPKMLNPICKSQCHSLAAETEREIAPQWQRQKGKLGSSLTYPNCTIRQQVTCTLYCFHALLCLVLYRHTVRSRKKVGRKEYFLFFF